MKLKKKNKGNSKLSDAIDRLIDDLRNATWENKEQVLQDRSDADCVHADGYFFFDIQIHRTMIMLEYSPDKDNTGLANILWAGSHEDYERIFKNNKSTIGKWLRGQGLID